MSCIKTFDNNATTGIFTGTNWNTDGVVEYLGYSSTSGGPYGAGGNWPWTTNVWGAQIDASNLDTGFYNFKYRSQADPTDPCYGEVIFEIAIVQGTFDVPVGPVQIALCSGDAIRNIFDDSGLFDLSTINPVDATIAGDTGISGYSAGDANIITDDTYDPSTETTFPIVRTFTLTYTPAPPAGFTLDGCENCDPESIVVEYTITAQFETGPVNQIAICNDGDI